MSKKIYDEPINKNTDWGGDESTGNLPVSGNRVQEFIKNQFCNKFGALHYDSINSRYYVFADEESKEEYLNDNTKQDLILGSFDAPFNYTASIKLEGNQFVNIFKGTTGNYLNFTFDIVNKSGNSVGENITCTYTFVNGTNTTTVNASYNYGENVHFLIDDYLKDGSNTITITIQGKKTLAATTIAVIYKVIDLSLSDEFDISSIVTDSIEVPYTVSGTGTKVLYWYIDGQELDFIKEEDEVTDVNAARTKYIDVSSYGSGTHSLQLQVSMNIDSEEFKSDILYREFIIAPKKTEDIYFATKYTIPSNYGIKQKEDETVIYDIQQYISYNLNFIVYNGNKPLYTPVEIYVNNNLQNTINAENYELQTFTFTQYLPNAVTIKLKAGDFECNLKGNVSGSSFNLSEITRDLTLSFSGTDRNNSSINKSDWSYNNYKGTFNGFNFSTNSGWVDNSLYINNGASFSINYAPLGSNPENTGRTIEFSFKTLNVSNDDAVICDLTNNGVGLKVTASEVILTSRERATVSTKFKSEEDVRISFVINRKTGVTNKGLAFIYINGILSGATKYTTTDSFESTTQFLISGTSDAEVQLYQLKVYNTALTSDQILNNFILYQKTVDKLQEAYYRNDVVDADTQGLSMDKLQQFLPIMLITGNIPTLENTNNKKEQIIVDIDYYNTQDPTKSFQMRKAAMTPQGTSSMSYPKKNFRIYTKKTANTVLYDYKGNVVEDKLYSFKDGSQPVQTWCLKADYAESSGTHNTGIARLWNDVMYNTQIDGEFKLRTEAQKKALENGYEYDVRTTVDGFPILMFYRLNEKSDIIFLGKYNFNNDKSTESVFGFKDIPGFDNTRMQCWEVLNNGNHLALFQDTDNWDSEWTDAFEGRYPDSSTDVVDLKAFAEWVVSCKDNVSKFSTEKYEHLDVYKVAAYYIYLMRFGAVDQPVKNAMLTSEDGKKFFYINYDNDTINGVRNDGLLIYPPTITRQSLDTSYTTEVYAYAGHDSVLWNLCESDVDFMSIVSIVDNAMYQSGLKYADVIDMFDNQQAGKWCERIYNQDAQYKYIGPYVNNDIDNLFMLQGSREAHRKWWLSRRFNFIDSKFVSGAYKSNVLECKMASAPIGINFSITAGFDMEYGYGVNNIAVETNIPLNTGESHTFTTKQVLNLGDPMRIYSANNLQEVDLSNFLPYLSTINIAQVYDDVLGTKLKKLIIGNNNQENNSLKEIQGLSYAKRLEELNIQNCKGISSLNLSNAYNLKKLNASYSGLKSVDLPIGAYSLTWLSFPSTMQSLILKDLPNLNYVGLNAGFNFNTLEITGCPKMIRYNWLLSLIAASTDLKRLVLDNINWELTVDQLLMLVSRNYTWEFKGKVKLDSITQEQVDTISAKFGNTVFNKDSAFYVEAPDNIFLIGDDIVYEGDSTKYKAVVFSTSDSNYTLVYKISKGTRTGTTLNINTGELVTTENGNADAIITINCLCLFDNGNISQVSKEVTIKKRLYPTTDQLTSYIKGGTELINVGDTNTYTLELDSSITGRFSKTEWSFEGDLNEYITVVPSGNTCNITLNKEVTTTSSGTLSITLTKVIGGTITGNVTINAKNDKIAIDAVSNPEVMAIMYKNGLCASPDYMTKQECAVCVENDFYTNKDCTTDNSIFKNSDIKHFEEFKYFILFTKVPMYCFYNSNLINIELPSSIESIEFNSFNEVDLNILNCIDFTNINMYYYAFSAKSNKKNITELNLYFKNTVFKYYSNFIYDYSAIDIGDINYIKKVNIYIDNVTCNYAHNSYDVNNILNHKMYYKKNIDINIYIQGPFYAVYSNNKYNVGDFNIKNFIYIILNEDILNATLLDNITFYITNNEYLKTLDNGNVVISKDETMLLFYNSNIELPSTINYIYTNLYELRKKVDVFNIRAHRSSYILYFNYLVNTINIYTAYSSVNISNCTNLNIVNTNADIRIIKIDNLKVSNPDLLTFISSRVYKGKCYCNNIVIENTDDPSKYLKDGFLFVYNSNNKDFLFCRGVTYTPNSHIWIAPSNTSFYFCIPTYEESNFDTIILKGGSSDSTFLGTEVINNTVKVLDTSEYKGDKITYVDCSNLKALQTIKMKNNLFASSYYIHYETVENVYFTEDTTNIGILNDWLCLHNIYIYAKTAPTVNAYAFWKNSNDFTGFEALGEKTLYVPADSTGYDEGEWKNTLIDKCGFKLSKTL